MNALVQYESSSSDEEEGRPPSAARQAKAAKRGSSKSGGKKAKVASAEVTQSTNVQAQNPAGYSNDWQAMGYSQQGYGQTWPQGYDYSQYAQAYGQWGDYQQWANYYAGYGQQQQYGTQAAMQPPAVPPQTSSVTQSTTTGSSTSDVTPQPPPPSGPPSEKPPLPTGAPPAPSTTGQQPEENSPASQSQTTSSSVDSQVSTAGQAQAGSQDTSSGQANMDPNMMWNNMWNYQQYDPQAWSQYYAGQGYQDPNMAMGQWGQWGQQWQNWQQQQQQQGTPEQTGQQKEQQTQQQGGFQTTPQAATGNTEQKPPPQGPPPQGPPPQGPPPHGPPPGLNGQDHWQSPDWHQSWHPGQMGQRPPGPMDHGPRMRMRHMGPMDHGPRPRHRGPMDGPRHRHPPPMGQGPRMRHPMEHGPRGPMDHGQRPRHHGPMDQRPRHPGGMDQRPRHRHPGPMDFGQRPRHPGGMDQRPRHPPLMDKGQQPRFPGSADQGPRPMERPRNPGAVDQGPRSRFPGPMDQSQRPRHPGPMGPRGRAPDIGEGKDTRWSGQPWQRDNRGPKDQDDQQEDQESEQPQKKEEPATEEKQKPALSLAERLKMIAESKAPQTGSASSHLASRPTPAEKDKKKGSDEKGNANYVPLGFNKLQQMSRGNQGSDDGREGRGPRGERGGRGDRGGQGGRGGRDDRGGRRSRFGQDDEPRGSSWGRDRNQPSYRSGREGRPDREGRDRDSRSDRDGRSSRFSHDSRDRQGDSQPERRGSRFSGGPPSHGEQSKPGGEGNVRSNIDGKQSRWETPRSTGTDDPQKQPKTRTKWETETTDGQESLSKALLPDPTGQPGGGGNHQGNPPSLFDIQVQPSSHLQQGQGQGGQLQLRQREQESNPPGPRGSPSVGPRGPSPTGLRGPSPTGLRGPTPPGPRGSPSSGPRGLPPPQFQGHNQGNWSQQNFGSPEGQGSGMKRVSSNDSQFSPSDGGPGIHPYTPKRARLEPGGSPSNPSPTGMVLQDTTMAAVQDIFEPYPKIVFALGKALQSRIPEKRLVDLQGHTGPVNTVEWCKADCSHLLLSSSMDRTVRVWDAIGDAKCVRTLTNHRAGVKMAAWTSDKKVLSCSFDKTAQLTDPQTGQTVSTFPHSNFVTVVRVHPQEHNLFLTGSTDIIQAWDSRTGKAVRDFKCKFGSVLDLAFLSDGKSFVSSADVVARDSADKTIMVWDFSSAAKLSNQIFHERYSCPSLAVHPSKPNFIAQTNGDYIALFSTSRPYAMDKTVRFEGHKVQGYRIGCEFTPDGQMIVTGSGDGKVHYFNFYSGESARELNVYTNPCTDVKSHPVLSSTLATCSWSGQVSVWQ
ncbi:uncharacterized protein LOC144871062 [Branchiostoma floridae x Branchiostoma japonicum]